MYIYIYIYIYIYYVVEHVLITYYPDAYLSMPVAMCLLTTLFTQRNSCIGRPQPVSL